MSEEMNQVSTDSEASPSDVRELRPKMKLQGQVSRIELYGAFVDIGVGRDGLVHISQLREGRVNRVADVVSEGDEVTVWVIKVDLDQGRISLTMIEPPERTIADLDPGTVLSGKVTRLTRYGAFVDIGVERDGLVHVSEMAEGYVKDPGEYVSVGDKVDVRVASVDVRKRQIELSMVDLPVEGLEETEEGEQEAPTAVELALKEAMSQSDQESTAKPRRKRRKALDDERAEILARTLRISKKE